jgi:hypothetical protein
MKDDRNYLCPTEVSVAKRFRESCRLYVKLLLSWTTPVAFVTTADVEDMWP